MIKNNLFEREGYFLFKLLKVLLNDQFSKDFLFQFHAHWNWNSQFISNLISFAHLIIEFKEFNMVMDAM